MARRDTPEILTIQEAYEKSTLDTLRPLAKLLDPNAPSKKADLVPFLTRKMGSKEQVQELYESLGDLGKSTVREAVHSPMGQLDPSRSRPSTASYRVAGGEMSRANSGRSFLSTGGYPATSGRCSGDSCRNPRSLR